MAIPSRRRSLTTRHDRIVNAAVEIQTLDSVDADELGFGPKCLVAASLPFRNVRPEQLQNGCWVRTNGNYTLSIQPGEVGMPYGSYPRIFAIWLTREALRTKSRYISLRRSFAEFCRAVDIDRSRGRNGAGRRMVDQIDRLLSSRAAFINHAKSGTKHALKKEFLQLSTEFSLFWDEESSGQCTIFESTVVLTQEFFDEITTHNIPLDMRVVACLKQSPLALDIYQWLAYRFYTLRNPSYPSWQQLFAQFGSSYAKAQLRFFKRDFLKALKTVLVLVQHFRVEESETGLVLLPSRTPIISLSVRT